MKIEKVEDCSAIQKGVISHVDQRAVSSCRKPSERSGPPGLARGMDRKECREEAFSQGRR
jgi:hypothetical protein